MNFLSLDAVIIPKRLEDLSHKKIKDKLIFDCDISLKYKDFIIDEFGVIDIEIYSFIANLDVFAMSKITLDKVDPPQDYLEDYNYFGLDIDEISEIWKKNDFSYQLSTMERLIELNDIQKIKKFLGISMIVCKITNGYIIIKHSIPNFIEVGLYDNNLFAEKLYGKLDLMENADFLRGSKQ